MSLYFKIILVLLGLAYLISPVDIIPDLLLPYVGWLDDGVVLWVIFHLIRYGELPLVFSKNKPVGGTQSFSQHKTRKTGNYRSGKGQPPPGRSSNLPKKPFRSAHEILGVTANATRMEIQTAYKEKIKQYHPDKVSHLGEEFSHLAEEKFNEIQKAYERLKTQR